MQFGRYYEEFEVGAVYKHWPGKTVTEYDDHLFCLLTMNHHPLHLDAQLRREDDRLRQERGGRQLHLLAAARHVACPTSAARRSPTSRSSRCATSRRPSTATRSTARRRCWTRRRRSRRPTAASSTSRRSATSRTARSSASSAARSWCRRGSTSRPAAASSPAGRSRRRALTTSPRQQHPTRRARRASRQRAAGRRTRGEQPSAPPRRRHRPAACHPRRWHTNRRSPRTRTPPGPTRTTCPAMRADPYPQPRLLRHFARAGNRRRLVRQTPPAGHRPAARRRLPRAPHHQQPPVVVVHHGPGARPAGSGRRWPARHSPPQLRRGSHDHRRRCGRNLAGVRLWRAQTWSAQRMRRRR